MLKEAEALRPREGAAPRRVLGTAGGGPDSDPRGGKRPVREGRVRDSEGGSGGSESLT